MKFRYFLPVKIKKILKYILYSIQDFFDFLFGRNKKNLPPKRLNFVGSHDFEKVSKEFFYHFKKLGNLKNTDSVLDIGCGIGRMAIPISEFLTKGVYYGFDIKKEGIIWCKNNISKKFPNFHFDLINIKNDYYNKKGNIKSENFIFPYQKNMFSFIFATSVFTHMKEKQILKYFSEIDRVATKKSKIFLTFFLFDKETEKNKKANCNFIYKINENCKYSHKNNPEAEIAFDKQWMIKKISKYNFGKNIKIYDGSWSGKKNTKSYQDIVVCGGK